jgi:hypothetical protein
MARYFRDWLTGERPGDGRGSGRAVIAQGIRKLTLAIG